ncbi:hypothetical protein F4806DRAFT_499214 [Annulohypoxylon nitens]|nr:hypothetical protein F4806DRAFT_499214 [Annulohypoxylon nitens]
MFQKTPLDDAWKANKSEVDGWIKNAYHNEPLKPHIGHLQSPHASGEEHELGQVPARVFRHLVAPGRKRLYEVEYSRWDSLAVKSRPDNPKFVYMLDNLKEPSHKSLERRTLEDSPAWTEDLPYLVLSFVHYFDSRPLHEVPCRQPPDPVRHAYVDANLRLRLNGLLNRTDDMPLGDWALTRFGIRVLKHLSGQMISDLKGISSVPILRYHAAHMMARAELARDPNVKRVLIRMAVFAQMSSDASAA